jgi:uncharacterized protein YndB with AHSA1/START domain
MSTTHPRFTARIEGPPQTIFDLLADMPNYARWLTGSDAFGGTTQVSPYPVQLGTTYLDAGSAGQRPGSVTQYDPPQHIAFHHTMLLKKGPLTANIDVVYVFRKENLRILAELKRYVEAQPKRTNRNESSSNVEHS